VRKAYGIKAHNRTTIPDIVLGTQLEVLSASSITKELFTTPAAVYGCLFVVFRSRLYSAKKFSLLVSIRCLYCCCLFSVFLYFLSLLYCSLSFLCSTAFFSLCGFGSILIFFLLSWNFVVAG
jgi:hypothetical protein